MLTVRTSEQLRTRRHVKSYRAGPTSTGLPGWCTELGRIEQEEVALAFRKMHWLWRRDQEKVARSSRELRHRWLAGARRPRSNWR